MKNALLMMAYGSPERKKDIMDYLRDVYGGREPPKFAIEETENKYSRFGFKSPSSEILRKLTNQVKDSIEDLDVYMAFKHWKPSIEELVIKLRETGYERIELLPLFPIKNTSIQGSYIDPFNRVLKKLDYDPEVQSISGMTDAPSLTKFWVDSVKRVYNPGDFLIFSAHSLPHTIDQESEYYNIFKTWSNQIARKLGIKEFEFAFQSRGSYGDTWLEPSVYKVLENIENGMYNNVVTVPIGFIYDHLEVLYDLDFLFGNKVLEKGMGYKRAELPNNSMLMIETIKECVEMMKDE